MKKYIDADELHNQGWVATRYINWEPTPLNDNFRLEIEVKPFITFHAADVAEVRHGHWEKVDDNPYEYVAVCSVCRNEVKQPTCMLKPIYSYCPICGAKMDEGKDND